MLKWIAIAVVSNIVVLAGVFVVGLVQKGAASRSAEPLGMQAGMLQPCPQSPNCVSSEQGTADSHYQAAISLTTIATDTALERARSVLELMGGVVVSTENDYLAAEFKSSLFGFVDDFELRLDRDGQLLHFRSASREGYSDLGVNAERVVTFKARLQSD